MRGLVVAREVSERVGHERLVAALAREPGHGADHVRVGPQHHVHAQVGQELRVVALGVVGLHEVLGAPVHGNEHNVGQLLGAGDVGLDAVLVHVADGVVGQVLLVVAVDAVGVVEQGKRDAVALDGCDLLGLLRARGRPGKGHGLGVPHLARVVVGAEVAPVVGVVGGRPHEVKARVHDGVRHLVGGVERGVALGTDVVAAQMGLLLHIGKVSGLNVVADRRVDGGVVVVPVIRLPGLGVRIGGHLDLREVVAHGHKADPRWALEGRGRLGRRRQRRTDAERAPHHKEGGEHDHDGEELRLRLARASRAGLGGRATCGLARCRGLDRRSPTVRLEPLSLALLCHGVSHLLLAGHMRTLYARPRSGFAPRPGNRRAPRPRLREVTLR